MDREADDFMTVLRHPELEKVRDAGGYLPRRPMVGGRRSIRGCWSVPSRKPARMGDRHRDGAQADGSANFKAFGQQAGRRDEALPLQVRFKPGQEQERCSGPRRGVRRG